MSYKILIASQLARVLLPCSVFKGLILLGLTHLHRFVGTTQMA